MTSESDEPIFTNWEDIPEKYQKKILDGTMTEEDWDADWQMV